MTWLLDIAQGLGIVLAAGAILLLCFYVAWLRESNRKMASWGGKVATRLNELTTKHNHLAECHARLTEIVLMQRARIEQLSTAPTDRALGVRVAKLELLVMPAVSDEWAESAHEAWFRKTQGGQG